MRRVFSGLARGVFVSAVVLALAVPAVAQPRNPDRGGQAQKIIKAVKQWFQTVFEDRMSEPKP
jgi:hypothetical protein